MHDEKHYQRRLIPVNIVVMALCLVAALSILFAPLLEIDLGKMAKGVQEAAAEIADQPSGGSGSEDEELQKEAMDALVNSLDGHKLSITTMGISRIARSGDIMASIASLVADTVESMADRLLTALAVSVITSGSGVSPDEETLQHADTKLIYEKFADLETCSPSEKDAVIKEFTETLWEQLGLTATSDMTQADIEETVSDLYDEILKQNNGTFTVEACICITLSEVLAQESGDENAPIYRTYDELFAELFGNAGAEGGEELESTMTMVSTIGSAFTYAMYGYAGVWLVLFVFALLHLFLSNKRFVMWYVKLFGCYPCIIFFLAPMIAKSVLASVEAEGMGVALAILGSISSTMWIVGVCYLLLWAVSIFWAFPIKRKIRQLRKMPAQG